MAQLVLPPDLSPERIVLAACLGDFAPAERQASLLAQHLLIDGELAGCPEILSSYTKHLLEVAAHGRFDVCDRLLAVLPPLRDPLINLLPDLWSRHESAAAAAARRYGLSTVATDGFLNHDSGRAEWSRRGLLEEMTRLARPSARAAAALLIRLASNRGWQLPSSVVSDDAILRDWAFLFAFVDTPESVNQLRSALIEDKQDGLLARIMEALPAAETDLETDLMAAARSGNETALEAALARRPSRTQLASALTTGIACNHDAVVRRLYDALGRPPVDRFVPAMLDANRLASQPRNTLPLDCSGVRERTVLRALLANGRRQANPAIFGSLFASGAPVSLEIGQELLRIYAESGWRARSASFPLDEVEKEFHWFLELFGPGGRGAGLLHAGHVRYCTSRVAPDSPRGRRLPHLIRVIEAAQAGRPQL